MTGKAPDKVRGAFLEGVPWERGLTYRSWQSRQAVFIDHYPASPHADSEYRDLGIQSVAFIPILTPRQEPQAILELAFFTSTHIWTAQERRFLQGITATLGLALERAQASEQLREMLDVIRQLAQADDPSALYQRVVEAAVRLIPDSDAASLLVQQPEGYAFQGSYGYDLAQLELIPPIPEAVQLLWYGGAPEDCKAGVPRILRGSELITEQSAGAGGQNDQQHHLQGAGKVSEIQSTLCVPITHHQEVLGLLNIDSLTREDAFGERDLKLAEAFAQQLAVIIRQAQYRSALEKSVVTDALTGLGNRAGFNMQLQNELLTAKRYGQPLTLIVMDLNGFKAINDTLGHQAGDEALIAVARALESERRQADSLFRWGRMNSHSSCPRRIRQVHRLRRSATLRPSTGSACST